MDVRRDCVNFAQCKQDERYIASEHMDKVREGETGTPSRSQPGLT